MYAATRIKYCYIDDNDEAVHVVFKEGSEIPSGLPEDIEASLRENGAIVDSIVSAESADRIAEMEAEIARLQAELAASASATTTTTVAVEDDF